MTELCRLKGGKIRSVYIEKFRRAWNVFASQEFELKGEVLKKPQYQEKKRVQMTFHSEVNLIVGLNVKWRMILAVVNSIYAIAQKAWKHSGLQRDLN